MIKQPLNKLPFLQQAFAPPSMGAKAPVYQHMETSRVYFDQFIWMIS